MTMALEKQPTSDGQSSNDAAASANNTAAHPKSPLSTPWLTPASALLVSSLPLAIGGYIGYRRALQESSSSSSTTTLSSNTGVSSYKGKSILGQIIIHPETPISSSSSSSTIATTHSNNIIPKPTNNSIVNATTPPPILAARALVLGSILSITATSLLVSGIFYASGCNSLDELISTWKSWAPNKLHQVENALGITAVGEDRRLAKFEYEQAIKGMTEEEELEYVRKKYGKEIQWDDADDKQGKSQ